MRTTLGMALVAALAACSFDGGNGTQFGALKENADPQPPTDLVELDLVAAVQEAFQIAGAATMATAWGAHVDALGRGTAACPSAWMGPPPEDFVDINVNNQGTNGLLGLSWIDQCSAEGGTNFSGFSFWQSELVTPKGGGAPREGERLLIMDGRITDANGALLLDFDGEASDQLQDNAYQSDFVARVLSGSLVGFGSGLRGELETAWSVGSNNALAAAGSVHVLDGFGPPDTRDPDPENTPEIRNVTGWVPGAPRYTSVRFDLEFDGKCPLEPLGYVGVRGNEGFWFDVYFLPKYDPKEESARAGAFPYESIDNVTCDGIGTLFVRNLDLRQVEADNAGWSREIEIDFGSIIGAMPTPGIEGFVYTIQDLPQDNP